MPSTPHHHDGVIVGIDAIDQGKRGGTTIIDSSTPPPADSARPPDNSKRMLPSRLTSPLNPTTDTVFSDLREAADKGFTDAATEATAHNRRIDLLLADHRTATAKLLKENSTSMLAMIRRELHTARELRTANRTAGVPVDTSTATPAINHPSSLENTSRSIAVEEATRINDSRRDVNIGVSQRGEVNATLRLNSPARLKPPPANTTPAQPDAVDLMDEAGMFTAYERGGSADRCNDSGRDVDFGVPQRGEDVYDTLQLDSPAGLNPPPPKSPPDQPNAVDLVAGTGTITAYQRGGSADSCQLLKANNSHNVLPILSTVTSPLASEGIPPPAPPFTQNNNWRRLPDDSCGVTFQQSHKFNTLQDKETKHTESLQVLTRGQKTLDHGQQSLLERVNELLQQLDGRTTTDSSHLEQYKIGLDDVHTTTESNEAQFTANLAALTKSMVDHQKVTNTALEDASITASSTTESNEAQFTANLDALTKSMVDYQKVTNTALEDASITASSRQKLYPNLPTRTMRVFTDGLFKL